MFAVQVDSAAIVTNQRKFHDKLSHFFHTEKYTCVEINRVFRSYEIRPSHCRRTICLVTDCSVPCEGFCNFSRIRIAKLKCTIGKIAELAVYPSRLLRCIAEFFPVFPPRAFGTIFVPVSLQYILCLLSVCTAKTPNCKLFHFLEYIKLKLDYEVYRYTRNATIFHCVPLFYATIFSFSLFFQRDVTVE